MIKLSKCSILGLNIPKSSVPFPSSRNISIYHTTVISHSWKHSDLLARNFAGGLSKKKQEAKEKQKQRKLEDKIKRKETKKRIEEELAAEVASPGTKKPKVKKEKKERPSWIFAKRKLYRPRQPEDILNKRSWRALDVFDKTCADVPKITYTELAKILVEPETKAKYKLIDLRDIIYDGDTPLEGSLRVTGIKPFGGSIANSILQKEFSTMTDSAFKKQFGFDKPKKDEPIIFISNLGKRAVAATKVLSTLGFTNVRYLYGGLRLWYKYNPQLHQPKIAAPTQHVSKGFQATV